MSKVVEKWFDNFKNQLTLYSKVEERLDSIAQNREDLIEDIVNIKASMSSVGAGNIKELHQKAELEVVSALSIREGQVHDIYLPGNDPNYTAINWGE